MRLLLLGVRGSTAAPGADHVRYGGHTSCVAVRPTAGGPPVLCLDAGTGLRRLSTVLDGQPYRGAIVLTHLHWDHMQGIPFFAAGDRHDASVEVFLPAQDGRSARDLLSQAMSPPAFPITPDELGGSWRFTALEPGDHEVCGLTVRAADVCHKGGRTFGYRVSDAGRSCAYLPDHAPATGLTEQALDLVRGVDVLLHDAQFLDSERRLADAYGHATIGDAIELAVKAGVGALVLTHHSPGRTDAQLDEIAAALDAPLPVVLAREGDEIDVTPPPGTTLDSAVR